MDRRITALMVLASVGALLWAAPAEGKRKNGEIVRITGQVLDPDGQPVDGVIVVLAATKSSYSFLKRQKTVEPPLRQTAAVDARGRFELEWHWDRYYNDFTLFAGLEVSRGGAPGFERLTSEQNISDRLKLEGPTHVTLTLNQHGYADWLKRFLTDRSSPDEEKIFREVGRPDRIRTHGRESSWWYFELGTVYRFENGKLEQVIHFDPMTPASSSSSN